MDQWLEIVKIFGTGVTAGGVMGLWIWNLLKEKTELQTRNDNLTDYIQQSDKSNLQLLTEMRMLIATLTANQDKLPSAIKELVVAEMALIKQTLDALQTSFNNRSKGS